MITVELDGRHQDGRRGVGNGNVPQMFRQRCQTTRSKH